MAWATFWAIISPTHLITLTSNDVMIDSGKFWQQKQT
jgi:hypothetical protein